MELSRSQKSTLRKSLFILIILLFISLFIVLIVLTVLYSKKTANIEILVAPESAEITLNNVKYQNGTHQIEPGEYQLNIKKEGFKDYKDTININAGETYNLYHYLTMQDGSYTWYIEHEEDGNLLNTIGEKLSSNESEKYIAKDPIFKITPYYNYDEGFEITADNTSTPIKIDVYLYSCNESEIPILKDKVKKWLKENKIKIKKYQLNFTNC